MTPPLFHRITPDELHYPYEFHNNSQLIDSANSILRPPASLAVDIFMICDVIQCFITLIVCTFVMVRKGRMKNIKLFSLRKSPYGTFIVPNAVFVMLACVYIFLPSWAGFSMWIIYVQKTHKPLVDWLWYIPFPWMPCALAGFYSSYGFMLTCSPRSPLSNMVSALGQQGKSSKTISWYYLPLPKSAWLMNTYMVSVGVIMVGYNVVIQSFAGVARTLTGTEGHNLYHSVLVKQHTDEWLAQAPSADLLALVKTAWAGQANVYRWCCLAIASYGVIIILAIAQSVLYAVPNQIFLILHLCRIFPDPVPDNCQGSFLNKVRMLLTVGWPRALMGPTYVAYKKTWMLTMVGHTQSMLLLCAICAFSVAPAYLFFAPWLNIFNFKSPDSQVTFIVAYVISVALLTAAWVTGLSAILTFEEIFRAVAGMGTTGTQVHSDQTGTQYFSDAVSRSTCSKTHDDKKHAFKSPHSPTMPLVRPKPSFATSAADKTEVDDNYDLEMGPVTENRLIIVTQTTIKVERDGEFSSMAVGPESLSSYPPPFTGNGMPAIPNSPYSFLSRKSRTSSA